jgi:hypothetical protein
MDAVVVSNSFTVADPPPILSILNNPSRREKVTLTQEFKTAWD